MAEGRTSGFESKIRTSPPLFTFKEFVLGKMQPFMLLRRRAFDITFLPVKQYKERSQPNIRQLFGAFGQLLYPQEKGERTRQRSQSLLKHKEFAGTEQPEAYNQERGVEGNL